MQKTERGKQLERTFLKKNQKTTYTACIWGWQLPLVGFKVGKEGFATTPIGVENRARGAINYP